MKLNNPQINALSIGLFISLVAVLVANVFILIRYRQDSIESATKIANLEAEVNNQREQKNTIRNLWEEQASSSDKIIIAQTNLLNRINDVKLEIKRSVRFVNTIPELLPTISEERLISTQEEMDKEIENLNEKTQENAKIKEEAKGTIDSIFLFEKEEQDNRAKTRND